MCAWASICILHREHPQPMLRTIGQGLTTAEAELGELHMGFNEDYI